MTAIEFNNQWTAKVAIFYMRHLKSPLVCVLGQLEFYSLCGLIHLYNPDLRFNMIDKEPTFLEYRAVRVYKNEMLETGMIFGV